jgi:hypothetical protein
MTQVLQGMQALARMIPSAVPFFAETISKLSQIVPSPESTTSAVAGQNPFASGPPQGAPPDMNASNQLPTPPGA